MSGLTRLLSRERLRNVSIAVLAVNALLYAAVLAGGHFPFDRQGMVVLPDFMAHLTGGALVAGGHASQLYDVDTQHAFEQSITHDARYLDVFLSPPLTSVLYAPFASLSYALAALAWTLVSLALLALSARILVQLLPRLSASDRTLFLLLFFASQPVIQLLGSGQDTALSLALWAAGVHLALTRRDVASGLVFSLGLFKPQLFFFPPVVFLLLRRRTSAASWGAGALAQGGLTLAIFGTEGVRGWWRILHSQQYLVALRAGRGLRMGSVVPFLESVVPDSLRTGAGIVAGVLCLGLVVATIARSLPTEEGRDERAVWALACAGTLLVTPHLFYYDLALLVVPVALLLDIRALTPASTWALVVFSILTWTAAARAPLEGAAWPLWALAASWTPLPLFVLWREIPTRLSPGVRSISA